MYTGSLIKLKVSSIVIEQIGKFKVLRDDLTFGGTKRIALENWLPSLKANHVIYAGSVFGWGVPAVSMACQTLGIKCTILMSESKYQPVWLRQVQESSTRLLIKKQPLPVEVLHEEAEAYTDCYRLPLGFDDPGFRAAIGEYARTHPAPERAWVPVVSGTLLRALEEAWPYTEFHGVCAARRHGYEGNATLYLAPEKYSQPAETPPPYPSCSFSDAKVWQFASLHGLQDDLIWNTNP